MKSRTAYAPYIIRRVGDETTAKCIKCLNEKAPNEYYKHSLRPDGYIRYRQLCKECRRKNGKKNKSRPIHEKILQENAQICKYCNDKKPLSEFYSNGCFYDGLKKYRSTCKNCVLNKSKERHKETYHDKINKKHNSYKNYISTLLNHCSKRKNKHTNLDIQYLIDLYEEQNGICNLSGIKMTHEYGKKSTNISIDRIDSSIGYLKGNVQLVCYFANIMKNQFSVGELLYFAEKIVTYSQNNNKNA